MWNIIIKAFRASRAYLTVWGAKCATLFSSVMTRVSKSGIVRWLQRGLTSGKTAVVAKNFWKLVTYPVTLYMKYSKFANYFVGKGIFKASRALRNAAVRYPKFAKFLTPLSTFLGHRTTVRALSFTAVALAEIGVLAGGVAIYDAATADKVKDSMKREFDLDLSDDEVDSMIQDALATMSVIAPPHSVKDLNGLGGSTAHHTAELGNALAQFIMYNDPRSLREFFSALSPGGAALMGCRLAQALHVGFGGSEVRENAAALTAMTVLANGGLYDLPSVLFDDTVPNISEESDIAELLATARGVMASSHTAARAHLEHNLTTEFDSLGMNLQNIFTFEENEAKNFAEKMSDPEMSDALALVAAMTPIAGDAAADGDEWYDHNDKEEAFSIGLFNKNSGLGRHGDAYRRALKTGNAEAFTAAFYS